MKIHFLPTGTVTLKRAFLHPRPGLRRRLDLLLPGPWAAPVPIGAWLIEHGAERILVDAGELANPKDTPFARHAVAQHDELPAALNAIGLTPDDITTALLTHVHPDHYRGTVHLTTPVLVHTTDWEEATSTRGRILQRLSGAPLPDTVAFERVTLDDGPFGSFAASRNLTADGRIVLVSTPGHTPGHTSVIAIDDRDRHVLIAGDATDNLQQLYARRADAITSDPDTQVQTLDRILAHAAEHPTIYLPTHDPESVARLHAGTTVN